MTQQNRQLVPASLSHTLLRWAGEEGASWLAGLPLTVARLQRRWDLTLEGPLRGGSCSLVLRVSSPSVGPAVLKVPFPDPESRMEHAALLAYAGDGAVTAHAFDPTSGAMLLERITPGASLGETRPLPEALEVAGTLLARLRRPAPAGLEFESARLTLGRWATNFRETYGFASQRWPELPVEEAAELADRLAFAPSVDLLVNRDAHLGNFLSAEREPWLLIDPKPMLGDPACDGGFLLLDVMKRLPRCSPKIVAALLDRLAACLECSSLDLRAWALIRAVENVSWADEVGADQSSWISRAVVLARL